MKYAVLFFAGAIFLSPSLTARQSFADTTSLSQTEDETTFSQELYESPDSPESLAARDDSRVNRSPAILGPPILAPAQPTREEMGYIYYDYTDEIPVEAAESDSSDR